MGGNLPFIPGVYQPNSTIAELILRSGQQQAQSQERLGQTFSNAILNIGDAASQGFKERARIQNEQKTQGVVAQGMASPDAFEAALATLPKELQGQARKEYVDASDAAARIAERHAKTAQDQAMTLKARHDLEQKNMDDMGTIVTRVEAHASDQDQGLSAMLAAQHAMKVQGVKGVENFDGPLQELTANWQKAVASNDPAQIAAAAAVNGAARKSIHDQIMMNVSPEHEAKLLAITQGKFVPIGPEGLYNTTTGQTVGGGPKPITPYQQAQLDKGQAILDEDTRHHRAVESKEPAAEPLVAIVGPDGKPVLVPRSQALGKMPAGSAEKTAPPGKLTKDERQQFSSINYVLPKLDSFAEYVKANPDKYGKWDAFVTNLKQQVPGLASGDYATKAAFVGRMNAEIRHALFGSALTKGEKESAKSFMISESDQIPVILGKIQDAKARMQNDIDYYASQGYKVGKPSGPKELTFNPATGRLE